MPPVDLENLVSACAGVSCDSKISCETLATTTDNNLHTQRPPAAEDETEQPEIPADFPPESFWLSKDAEFDWFDRNAFFERKDSTKGNSHSTNLNPNINNQSSSQRFSNLKSKASIIGLPKPQKTCFVEARRNCKPGRNTRLFPKRSASTSKSDCSMIEPSSPKVSCIGRVRSKRDRNRRLKNRKRSGNNKSNETEIKTEKSDRKHRDGGGSGGGGFFASFRSIFRARDKHRAAENGKDESSSKKSSVTVKTTDIRDRLPASDRNAPPRKSVDSEAAGSMPIGLGGMNKFASGRKSESWVDVA